MSEKKRYTPAAIAARERYNKKKYDEIKFRVPKGQKELIKSAAEAQSMSLTAYIVNCIEKNIKSS